MHSFDRVYFYWNKLSNYKKNRRFKAQHPLINLPPDYMLYEAYRLDYSDYWSDGQNTAQWLAKQVTELKSTTGNKVLEWGCGPARIIRHMPACLPGWKIYATDYNEATIQWCMENIQDVNFFKNELEPPLPFNQNAFDFIYALSVFTHLSESYHHKWMHELNRILKPGGILLLTTHGNAFLNKLTKKEKLKFMQGSPVFRSSITEGHRTYTAFQSGSFMHKLFSADWKILKFNPGFIQSWGPEQDTWIVEKQWPDVI
jgi:ubiquinone/menaquinone biosynthesis C-methylase UbiE